MSDDIKKVIGQTDKKRKNGENLGEHYIKAEFDPNYDKTSRYYYIFISC